MNGATAEPSVKIINAPNKTRKITIGANHHFFRTFKNSQNSDIIDSLLIRQPPIVVIMLKTLCRKRSKLLLIHYI